MGDAGVSSNTSVNGLRQANSFGFLLGWKLAHVREVLRALHTVKLCSLTVLRKTKLNVLWHSTGQWHTAGGWGVQTPPKF
jgi:hypothetical protein